jgi:hypothetical protein
MVFLISKEKNYTLSGGRSLLLADTTISGLVNTKQS